MSRLKTKLILSLTDVDVSCTTDKLHLTVRLSQPFLGLLHARGFPAECVIQGHGERVITLSLPTTGCGVRLAAVKVCTIILT